MNSFMGKPNSMKDKLGDEDGEAGTEDSLRTGEENK
jgi:hypothetical protein